jgi:hypothetical protein
MGSGVASGPSPALWDMVHSVRAPGLVVATGHSGVKEEDGERGVRIQIAAWQSFSRFAIVA